MIKKLKKIFLMVFVAVTLLVTFAFSVCAKTYTSNMIGNCEPYSTKHCTIEDEITMGGNTYEDALLFKTGYTGVADGHTADAKFNFNGKYESMTFYAGYVKGVQSTGYLTVSVDGEEKEKVLLSSSDLPKSFTVSLKGVNQVTLKFDGNNGYDAMYYGIGGINLVSNGTAEPSVITSNIINNCEPYSSTHCTFKNEIQMGGNTYKDAYVFRTGYTGYSNGNMADMKFNFNGTYESMTFYAGYYSGVQSSGYLSVIIDGEEESKTLLSAADLPKMFTVDLKDVHQLIIKFDGNNGYDGMYYGIGGINLVSNGVVQGIKMLTENIELSEDNMTSYAKAVIIPCDADNQNIIWTSSNSVVAKVNNKGLITAVSGGEVVITAKTEDGGYIATVKVNVDLPVMPDSIKNIAVSARTTNAVKLTWDAVDGADSYLVYQKTANGWKTIGSTTNNAAVIKNLTAGTKYTFAVKTGKIIAGKAAWSNVYVLVDAVTQAVKPAKIVAAQNTSAIKLSWTKCAGATGYRIYYKSGNSWKVCVKATTSTSHTFKNLKAGAKFTFAVRPYIITDGGVVWSSYTTFTTATKPATVTAKVSSPSSGKVTLTWNAVAGADGYQVYYKIGNGSYKLYKTYGKAGTLNFSNLKSGTEYTFAVRAGIKTSGGNIWGAYKASTVTVK